MSGSSTPPSIISSTIARYVALKQALGRAFAAEERILAHLDSFLHRAGSDLTAESFGAWCLTLEHLTSGVRRNWMRVARNLCLYRCRTEPSCFVPDPSQFPPLHQPVQAHIFTEDEVARLLRAADQLAPGSSSPLRRQVFRLAIVLLYTSGLRRGELLRLVVGDYDPVERALLIRESKFHKSRLLPLSQDASREFECYLAARRRGGFSTAAEVPVISTNRGGGRPYTGVGFGSTIQDLFRATGVRTTADRDPRVHDFRHTFAVRALLRWYHAGDDVQAKLPVLATYMGHVSIVSTQYYLRFVDELAAVASDRFARRCGALVTVLGNDGGA
jgi:integrase/recombinase XerD